MMPSFTRMYRLAAAAKRLRMSIRAVREHLYRQRDLEADGLDDRGQLLFSEQTLTDFKLRKRRRGRPKVYHEPPS